jgi:hypothetical protein
MPQSAKENGMKYLTLLMFGLIAFFVVFFFILLPLTELSKQSAAIDKARAEVALTQAQVEVANASARKVNAEAHRLENELDRDKFGWTAVTVKENGLGAISGLLAPCVFGAVVLLLVTICVAVGLKSKSD